MRPITAILAAAAVALPWYVWVHLRTDGAWTHGFFVVHNVGRAMSAMDGHDFGPLFYPVALLAGTFPWSIFWLPALFQVSQESRQGTGWRPGAVFALCWVGVYLGLFTIARTKLPSYITPCYPGVALVLGAFVDRWASGDIRLAAIWPRLAYGSLILAGIGVGIVMPILTGKFLPGEESLALLGLIPFVGGLAALTLAEKRQQAVATVITAFTAILMTTCAFGYAAVRIDRHRQLEDLVAAVYGGAAGDETDVASLVRSEASWVFYCRQPIEIHREPERAAAFLLAAPESRSLIASTETMGNLRELLPAGEYEYEEVPYFMEEDTLVVVRRSAAAERVAETPESGVTR